MPEQNNNQRPDGARNQANSLAAINKLRAGIRRSAVKLNDTVHAVALMCAEHAKAFGDVTPAAGLVDDLPMTHRRALLINWFDAFTPIGIAKDGKTGKMKGHLKGKADERDKMWNLAAGKATPWFAMPDVENEPNVPTLESWFNNIVAFEKRMAKKAEEIANENDRAKALEIVAALKAATPEKVAA